MDDIQTSANEGSEIHTLDFGLLFAINSSSIRAALFQGKLLCISGGTIFAWSLLRGFFSASRALVNPDSICDLKAFCSGVESSSGGKQLKPAFHARMHPGQEDNAYRNRSARMMVVQRTLVT